MKEQGSHLYMPLLAKTYQRIADDPMTFYKGSLAQDIVNEIKDMGGAIVLDDLKNYTVKWSHPSKLTMSNNLTLYSSPPPGAGYVLSYVLNILDKYNFTADSIATVENKILTYHRVIEAFKFGYAKRMELGDVDFVNKEELLQKLTTHEFGEATRKRILDHRTHESDYYDLKVFNKDNYGTTHLSVIDSEGNAVSFSSSINLYFGAMVIGTKTGIIYNNAMEDFAQPGIENTFKLPPSEANFIRPFKRPMSSMCPTIVWDESAQTVRLVTGAAGGSKIISASAWHIMNLLWFNMPIGEAADMPRFHHQLIPNMIIGFASILIKDKEALQKGLMAKGHEIGIIVGTTVVQTILVQNGSLTALSDMRKRGRPSGY